MPQTIHVYSEASKVRDNDLLLFRGRGVVAKLIQGVGRGRYSHAAKALWWNGRLMCVESREFRGCRAVLLSRIVKQQPGTIDVYRIQDDLLYKHSAAAKFLIDQTGQPYSYAAIIASALLHTPILRTLLLPWLMKGNGETKLDSQDWRPRYCSALCAAADCYAGVDPVPNLPNRLTEPNDLARSAVYACVGTLE